MINITFKSEDWELSVSGHAGHGKKGEDIVCSAVSILFYTLAESLTQSASQLKEEPIIQEEDGEGYICCNPKEEYVGNIARTYWTILNGMQLIADNYPDNVTLKVEG